MANLATFKASSQLPPALTTVQFVTKSALRRAITIVIPSRPLIVVVVVVVVIVVVVPIPSSSLLLLLIVASPIPPS